MQNNAMQCEATAQSPDMEPEQEFPAMEIPGQFIAHAQHAGLFQGHQQQSSNAMEDQNDGLQYNAMRYDSIALSPDAQQDTRAMYAGQSTTHILYVGMWPTDHHVQECHQGALALIAAANNSQSVGASGFQPSIPQQPIVYHQPVVHHHMQPANPFQAAVAVAQPIRPQRYTAHDTATFNSIMVNGTWEEAE